VLTSPRNFSISRVTPAALVPMSATGTPFDTVLEVQAIDNCSKPQLMKRFFDARTQEYRELLNLLRSPASRSGKSAMYRLRQRFHDIVSIDFFW